MTPLKTIEDYETAKGALRRAFNECNPYSLVNSGAPRDEYDEEIATILARAQGIKDAVAFATIIAVVLSESLGDECNASDCLPLAKCSFRELSGVGITL